MTRISFIVCVGSTFLLGSVSDARAEDIAYSAEYAQCMEKSDGEYMAMTDCITNETAAWDKKLNINYKIAMGKISKERQAKLKAVQILWIKYRDAKCGFIYEPILDGFDARLNGNHCFLKMTAVRSKELEDIEWLNWALFQDQYFNHPPLSLRHSRIFFTINLLIIDLCAVIPATAGIPRQATGTCNPGSRPSPG